LEDLANVGLLQSLPQLYLSVPEIVVCFVTARVPGMTEWIEIKGSVLTIMGVISCPFAPEHTVSVRVLVGTEGTSTFAGVCLGLFRFHSLLVLLP
jgi:hypothetical protein